MKTKGLKHKESFTFGLFHKKGKYLVEKIRNEQTEKPLLKFKSFTQGMKAVRYINANENFAEIENFKKLININKKDELWLSSGRILGEKSFLLFEKGKLKAYGFYELYTQIASLKKLSSLKIEIDFPTLDLQNELKMGLLRGDFEIVPIPLK
jgi:DNA polymerase-3 subunit epsilon